MLSNSQRLAKQADRLNTQIYKLSSCIPLVYMFNQFSKVAFSAGNYVPSNMPKIGVVCLVILAGQDKSYKSDNRNTPFQLRELCIRCKQVGFRVDKSD